MKSKQAPTARSAYWKTEGIEGVECLRTCGIQHQYGRHSHAAYAIGIIESGIGVNEYDGEKYFFPAGNIVAMNCDTAHTGSSLNDDPLSYRMFYIEASVFDRMLPGKRNAPLFPEVGITHNPWASRLLKLHKMLEAPTVSKLDYQSFFAETITAFVEQFSTPGITCKAGTEPKAVRLIKEYLAANYTSDISISDLVRITSLNRYYLIRAFKRSVGIPPYTYLNQIRIEQAKRLLKSGMPVAEVAMELRFTDQSHLTRHFKRITGITPKKYAAGHYRTRN